MRHPTETIMTGPADTCGLSPWVCWLRPRSYWSVAVFHLPLTLISAIALLLPHLVSLGRLPLIPCTFLHLTGFPCPLCGFTRSFWAIANGQWAFALANCPLAYGVFLSAAAVFAWNFTALVFGVVISRGPLLQLPPRHRSKALITVLLLFTMNWLYRLAMGFA